MIIIVLVSSVLGERISQVVGKYVLLMSCKKIVYKIFDLKYNRLRATISISDRL